MKTRSKTEIIVETHRILTIKNGSRRNLARCEECGKQAPMVTVDEAVTLCRVSSRAVYRWVESGQVHYTESPGGSLLVCPDSILKLAIKVGRYD